MSIQFSFHNLFGFSNEELPSYSYSEVEFRELIFNQKYIELNDFDKKIFLTLKNNKEKLRLNEYNRKNIVIISNYFKKNINFFVDILNNNNHLNTMDNYELIYYLDRSLDIQIVNQKEILHIFNLESFD